MDICETYSDRKLFCNDWEFYKAAFGSDYSEDFAFKPVDIPHDWLIYDTNDLYETSTGWYRKNFSYQKEEGIRTFIRFDGVYMDSKVYVNGALAGEWKYGYSAFMFDITDLVKNGENIITVRVDRSSLTMIPSFKSELYDKFKYEHKSMGMRQFNIFSR